MSLKPQVIFALVCLAITAVNFIASNFHPISLLCLLGILAINWSALKEAFWK